MAWKGELSMDQVTSVKSLYIGDWGTKNYSKCWKHLDMQICACCYKEAGCFLANLFQIWIKCNNLNWHVNTDNEDSHTLQHNLSCKQIFVTEN